MNAAARLARDTGVPVATVRRWQALLGMRRRPSLFGGQVADIDRAAITIMQTLSEVGWSDAIAAAEVQCRLQMGLGLTPGENYPGSAELDPLTERFLHGATTQDADEVRAAIDGAWATFGADLVADAWVMQAMHRLGDAWEAGRVTVAGEHLAARHVRAKVMDSLVDYQRRMPRPARLMVGTPANCQHDIGALSFAMTAAGHGWGVSFLGDDLTSQLWRATAAAGVAAVVMAIPRRRDVEPAMVLCAQLAERSTGCRMYIGGGYQDHLGDGPVHLGHTHVTALARLAEDLGDPGVPWTEVG